MTGANREASPDAGRAEEIEALIKIEVDRAVKRYEGVAPPVMMRKLRELSERYWRENPVAVRTIRLLCQQRQVISGPEVK